MNGLLEVRDSIPGLSAGVVGLAAGLLAVVFDKSVFGLLAGLAAVAATISVFVLRHHLHAATATQKMLTDQLKSSSDAQDLSQTLVPSTAETSEAVVSENLAVDSQSPPETQGDGASSLVDPITGLFSESFFNVALESRIAAARRHLRPISVVLIDVVRGLPKAEEPSDPAFVAAVLKQALREADAASWLANGHFALLLEDTPENGAIWTVERVRRKLLEGQDDLTVWAGVACYPAHAFASADILEAANAALVSAREWRQDRIEVAVAFD